MSTIYDLDNTGGGQILGNSDNTAPALKLDSSAAGYPALSILSTASGAPIKATVINSSIDIDSVAASVVPAVDVRSGATIYPAVSFGRTVNGSSTIGYVQFLGTSVASGAIMNFAGGFISLTSVVLTTVANTDYAIPVQVGLEVRYIPVFKAAALIGGAAF